MITFKVDGKNVYHAKIFIKDTQKIIDKYLTEKTMKDAMVKIVGNRWKDKCKLMDDNSFRYEDDDVVVRIYEYSVKEIDDNVKEIINNGLYNETMEFLT